MDQDIVKLRELVDLAHETSTEKRSQLLKEVSDIFLNDPETYSDQEVSYFGDIMDRVAFDLDRDDREGLALKLAEEKLAPCDLMYKLANDEISVAQPVLEKSPVLREEQLVEIASRHSQMHLLAMTNRQDITQSVSSTLVEHGDDEVLESLAGNHAAQISESTFMDMSERSKSNENIQEPLAKRPDLPEKVAQNMISFAKPEILDHLLSKHSTVKPIIGLPDEKGSAEEAYKQIRIEGLIEQVAAPARITENRLIELVRAGDMTQAVGAFAQLTGLDVPTARRVIFDSSGRALAVACKASKFDKNTYSSLILGMGKNSQRSIQETYQLVALYDSLDLNTAKRIMRFWQVRKAAGEQESGAETNGQTQPMPIPGLAKAI